ncbi:DUF3943 domain-containing protein [Treponema sp.]|uniref:DUF3943 domain-containing protein n=1 Tax=Treponema sp. TaxID=166 RepID=UPI00388F86EC
MKKIVSLFLFLLTVSNTIISAQSSDLTFNVLSYSESGSSEISSGFLHENDGKKHPLVAVGGLLFFNLGLSSYNRWVLGSGWAQTGWDEWDHFWEREMSFDRDWYWTNFVLHPYQGGIYYQVSRGSNLNQLESFAVTFAGSYMWEFLCETNEPSINDMYYTSVGSFAMGEMLYRLSLNADEISELFGHFINPTRWWTQLWTRQKPLGTTRNIHELSLKFTLGTARTKTQIINSSDYDYTGSEFYPVFFNPSIFIAYNDPYGHDSNDPYSQFEIEISASIGKGSGEGADCNYAELDKKIMYDIRILSNGMLFARAPRFSENTDTTIGLTMEYEFDWHQFYELTSLGPGFAVKQRVRGDSADFEWQLHGAWNVLGTTDYYYYHRPIVEQTASVCRNYSYTTGPMAIFKARYITGNGSSFNFSFRGYAMYDFYSQLQENSTMPSSGWEWIGVGNISYELALSKTVRLGVQDELYVKRAFYKKVPDVFQWLNSAGAFVKFQLK